MNGFRVCRKFAERARNSIDLRSEINFYSSSLNPPIIEEEGKKKKEKRKNGSACEFIIPRWIDFAKSSWIVKISLLLDEIPLWNQSQLNQTYFITQLPYPFGIGLPKSEIRQEHQNLLAAYNHHRERESSKERQGSINRIASCIRSLSNQLPPIFSPQFDPPNFKSHVAYETTFYYCFSSSFIYFLRVFLWLDAWFFFAMIKFHYYKKYCSNFYYFHLFESL